MKFFQNFFNKHPAVTAAPLAIPQFQNKSVVPALSPSKSSAAAVTHMNPEMENSAIRPGLDSSAELAEWWALKAQNHHANDVKQMEADRTRRQFREQMRLERLEREANARRDEERAQAEAERQQKELAEKSRHKTWDETFRPFIANYQGFTLTAPVIKKIVSHGKLEGYLASQAKKLKPIIARHKEIHAQRRSVNFLAAKSLHRESIVRELQSAQAGNHDSFFDPSGSHPETLEKGFEAKRIVLREQMRMQSDLAKPILLEIGDRLQAAARDLATERDKAERAQADEFEIRYEPSSILRAIVVAGFEVKNYIQHNYTVGPLVDYSEFMFGLVDLSGK